MREDIIKMAREARGYPATPTDGSLWLFSESHLERFADLVRADEREACAKLCEDAPEPDGQDLADRIRARGQA